jgi:hypothetical protein
MNRCNRDMQGVGLRPSRHATLRYQPVGKRLRLLVNGQGRDAL